MNLGRDISVIDVPDLGYDPQNLLSNVICSFRKFLFPLYTEHVRRQAYSGVGINMSFSSKYNPFRMNLTTDTLYIMQTNHFWLSIEKCRQVYYVSSSRDKNSFGLSNQKTIRNNQNWFPLIRFSFRITRT